MSPTESNEQKEALPKAYDPSTIEQRWADYWASERLFDIATPDGVTQATTKKFVQLLPPPNVTGRLHIGHMLNQTEMDILTRWHRMLGETAVWVPGTDHAGIATQMMVERQLKAEGTTRQQLGREAFEARVWRWKSLYGGAILDQMKRLGSTVDWSREYFTMDERLSVAVKEAFVQLYEQGLIYRGAYIVNWCPGCQTAVSDLEVVHEEQLGKLYEIRYPLADGSGSIVIATTRPETMLGDVAVAVNPADERYTALVGKLLTLPLSARGGAPDMMEMEGQYYYGNYYSVQAMFLAGGDYWADWYPGIREQLIARQNNGAGNWTGEVTDDYCTSMALIILQMPNRYLPVFNGKGPGD